MRRYLYVVVVVSVLAGCSGPGGETVGLDVVADGIADAADVTARVDVAPPGELAPDQFAADQQLYDGPLEEVADSLSQCQPGEGCFEDPCVSNDDCLSGWCVEHLGQKVCTSACQDECPPGWSCHQVAGTAPDLVFVCVSDMANLCRPCTVGSDCQSAVGTKDVCVDYGDEGSFCGGSCVEDEDCPFGFACADGLTVDGIDTRQCTSTTGVCPCTPSSVALALWTGCEIANEFGLCEGKRVCTAEGLTDCDASPPGAEVCNGLDDNCDGTVDEEGCDDGNPCTDDSCAGEEGCLNEPLDSGECIDGDVCTVGDHCAAGQCVGTSIDCDDDNPCTDDTCDGLGGCQFVANAADCNDGDPCTVADECDEGQCIGTAVSCDCQVDADCGALEDGDLCNGTLFCDLAKLPFLCAVAPGTMVECSTPEGVNAPCLAASCDPATGACSLVPANDGGACDDGDLCTLGDSCAAGTCVGGDERNCNDGNGCTDDSCESAIGCVYTNNVAPCFYGSLCTVNDMCGGGECQPGPALVCNDGNACTADTCEAESGCHFEAAAGACDDGDSCTGPDMCANGQCLGGPTMDCDDENPCTDDSCDVLSGCVHVLNSVPCNDGDLCTTGDHCQLGECAGGGNLVCVDGNVCTADQCDPEVGCQFVPNSAACDDGNPCTLGDHCSSAVCKATSTLGCDDGNPCTADGCTPDDGCLHLPAEGSCNDGDVCTINDSCVGGECSGGVELNCDDGDPCTEDACAEGLGCLHNPLTDVECDDSDPCTVTDSCVVGECVGSGELACEDGDVCTQNLCVAEVGCVFPPDNGVACDDANACTLVDVCADGQCFGTGAPNCDDDNACTEDSCVPPGGCQNAAVVPCCGDNQVDPPEECDDGNVSNGDGCDENCEEETAVTMQWTDPATGSCGGNIWQTMQQIVAAMPAGPINVKIDAKQVQPKPNYGEWSATFEQTDCVRKWLQAIANKDITTYNNWNPAVCQATSTVGETFFFVCKSAGNGTQIAIYPVGAPVADFMKVYMLDRTGAWCDLAGVNNRPGFDIEVTNGNTSGNAGDYLRFTWSF